MSLALTQDDTAEGRDWPFSQWNIFVSAPLRLKSLVSSRFCSTTPRRSCCTLSNMPALALKTVKANGIVFWDNCCRSFRKNKPDLKDAGRRKVMRPPVMHRFTAQSKNRAKTKKENWCYIISFFTINKSNIINFSCLILVHYKFKSIENKWKK